MALISAPKLNNRFTQLAIAALLAVVFIWLWVTSFQSARQLHIPGFSSASNQLPIANLHHNPLPLKPNHPIDFLVQEAEKEFAAFEVAEVNTVENAAKVYRESRGRQPPPGFGEWFRFAQKHDTVMVESFFDQIYDDLNPFWGVQAKQIREQANDFIHRVSVRDGKASKRTDIDRREWMDLWHDLVGSISEHLPDIDMPINVMDESRMVVEWEEINHYMTEATKSRQIVPEAQLKTTYQSLRPLDEHPPPPFDPGFTGEGPYWPRYVVGCPPDSPARTAVVETDFAKAPTTQSNLVGSYPKNSYEGYVMNCTLASSPCENPHLQGMHGSFIEPVSISNTKTFFPLFGGSKLPMNNEILLPPAMYWTDNPFYSGGKDHGHQWEEKLDKLIWRGVMSGGRNKDSNWRRFQRHRFVSMVNGTSVDDAETNTAPAQNFFLPQSPAYDLAARSSQGATNRSLGDWIAEWSDAAPIDLMCYPYEQTGTCSYTDPYYTVTASVPMKEQYSNKYLPDIDGNSFSGRYRGFLGSTSLPIKATVYREWHDSRLVPWKHFVPMDNTFIDIYGIMEYFVGNKAMGVAGHDDIAKNIALSGKAWAEKVLRKEDMQVYVYRLLLEYARICDDDREIMGWKEADDKPQ